jgi:ADP-ribosylglycohydrolase
MTGDRRAAGDSLRGLALGDGFGVRWFHQGAGQRTFEMIRARSTPTEAPFHYSDDTAMAIPIVRVLHTSGRITGQHLAEMFAATYQADPYRGYGYGMTQLLPRLAQDPGNWATYARSLFGGEGSLGNGAAMRVAPLGAWFHQDLEQVVQQATLSAQITHAHPEGIAGAVAVAVAAALSANARSSPQLAAEDFVGRVAELTPHGPIREGVEHARDLATDTVPWKAADVLGNGQRIRASDTVPFALWCAARHPDNLEDALWTTAE